jgi:cytochrome c556
MSRSSLAKILLPVALIAIAGVVFQAVRAEEVAKAKAPKQDLRDFMHQKLDASNKILEGLVTEDTELVRQGAQTLTEMSAAEKWKVSQNVMYLQFSKEFQRNAEKLVDAAKEKNLDRVALRWMDTTMSCIECHRFVRNELVTQGTPSTK